MKLMFTRVLYALLIALLMASCTQKPQEQILGKWKDDDGVITEFFEDGSMTMTNPNNKILGSATVTGNWIFLEDGRLKLSFSIMGMTNTTTGAVSFTGENTFEIKGEGKSSKMTRISS